MIDEEKFIKSIDEIYRFLNDIDPSAYFEQINYLLLLIELIQTKQYDTFFKNINNSELWGGSGAIWESEYGMSVEQRKVFTKLLLDLLIILKETNKINKRAKSILKYLSDSVTKER